MHMSEKQLSQKEFELLESLARNPALSQRKLAKSAGLSLGLINLIIKRFIQTGYIQTTQINKRKVEYLLTDQAVLKTTQKTQANLTEIVHKYLIIKKNLSELLQELYQSGYTYFSIHGNGELKELVEATFQSSLADAPVSLGQEHRDHSRAVILNLTTTPPDQEIQGKVVNVLEKIGEL